MAYQSLARPRRSFTPAQRAQSHAFWTRKATKAERGAEQRRLREDTRRARNTDVLRSVKWADDKLQKEQRAQIHEAPPGPRGPAPRPRVVPAPTQPSEARLLALTRQTADASEKRLRSYADRKLALTSAPTDVDLLQARQAARGGNRAMRDSMVERKAMINAITGSLLPRQAKAERKEIRKWIEKDETARQRSRRLDPQNLHPQDLNVRTLAAWPQGGKQWLARNRGAQRQPVRGEYLDMNEKVWTDYLNQGWMQGGYDRGAAFRLLTDVPPKVEKMHNRHARPGGDTDAYDKKLGKFAKKQWAATKNQNPRQQNPFWHSGGEDPKAARKSFFAQELGDAAGAGYVIHRDAADRQVLMPRAKSDMLQELRSGRPRLRPPPDDPQKPERWHVTTELRSHLS